MWGSAFGLVGLLAGIIAGQPLSAHPIGQATVLIRPIAGNAFSARTGNTLVDLETDAQFVTSDEVLGTVRPVNGRDIEIPVLRRRINVKAVANAEVIVLSYRGSTSEEAAAMAQRVADAYLEVRAKRAAAASKALVTFVGEGLNAAEVAFVNASEASEDAGELAVLSQRVTTLRSELRAVGGATPSPGSVLAATAPRRPDVLKLRLAIALGTAFLAGLLGIWFGQRPRRTRRQRSWISRRLRSLRSDGTARTGFRRRGRRHRPSEPSW
jgi:hypothetical protein